MSNRSCASIALLATVFSSATYAQETKTLKSQLKDQTSVSLTVYSNGRSMIRERRKVKVDKGLFALEFQDVSSRMLSETAQLRNVKAPRDLVVLEQNLEFDLLSPTKLLEKFVGRTVSVLRTHPTNGLDSSETAQVLSTQNGVVLKVKDRIETGLPGRIVFPEVPENLRAEPTLSLLVESRKSGVQDLELNYMSEGLTWKADYIANLNPTDDRLELTGYVTLTNQSGTSFSNAQLQFMAGQIQTVQNNNSKRMMLRHSADYSADSAVMSAGVPHMQGESFFEYHLYTLPRPTTLLSNQTKQVTLLQASEVTVRKEILFKSSGYYDNSENFNFDDERGEGESADSIELGKPVQGGVFVAFENNKASGLGAALPAGVVRVYKRDTASLSQFLGEDRISHVPENENVRVRLGSSFDVTARKKRLKFKNLPSIRGRRKDIRVVEYTERVTFKNAKNAEQKIIYRDSLPADSDILKSSFKHKSLGNGNTEWSAQVPAKGQLVLEYSVRAQLD
jgi:hypothetical protein